MTKYRVKEEILPSGQHWFYVSQKWFLGGWRDSIWPYHTKEEVLEEIEKLKQEELDRKGKTIVKYYEVD